MGGLSPAAPFVTAILAGLDYWREQTLDLDDQAIVRLDLDRQNLFRAMQYGLALPQAWVAAAAVAVQAIPLVNRRMYRTEWLPVLQQLLERAPANQERWRIQLMVQYGRLLRLQRQLDQALALHLESRAMAEQLGDRHLLAQVALNLGRDYLDKRQYEEAERNSQFVVDLLGDTGDQELVSQAYNALGQVARDRGVLEESLDYLTKALEIERNRGDVSGLGRALTNLANTLRAAGRLDEAIEYYEEAGRILAPTANELDKVLVDLNLGGAYYEMGEWSMAEVALRNANSAYLQQSGNIHYQAGATVSLGNVLMKQGRLIEAEVITRQSVKLWRQVDDLLNLANALGSLGEVLAAQGSPEAVTYLDEALELLSHYHEEPYAQRLRILFQRTRDEASSSGG